METKKTIFITGASSGIGRQTAVLFHRMGWNVVASMRDTTKAGKLRELEGILIAYCDIRVKRSVKDALQEAIDTFGKIDVLVNNAGCYFMAPFEKTSDEEIETILETNVMGTISMTKEALYYLRKQESATIVNISSIAGVGTVPLQSIYQTSKWALEGFSESLEHELRQWNIKIKIIEPGVIKTPLYNHTTDILKTGELGEYQLYTTKVMRNLLNMVREGTHPFEVAKTIYKAVNDPKDKMRYSVGKSKELIWAKKFLPYKLSTTIIRNIMENKEACE